MSRHELDKNTNGGQRSKNCLLLIIFTMAGVFTVACVVFGLKYWSMSESKESLSKRLGKLVFQWYQI